MPNFSKIGQKRYIEQQQQPKEVDDLWATRNAVCARCDGKIRNKAYAIQLQEWIHGRAERPEPVTECDPPPDCCYGDYVTETTDKVPPRCPFLRGTSGVHLQEQAA